MELAAKITRSNGTAVTGEFVDIENERYYAIRNVDNMEPFFISVISDDDHWLFVSSAGSLTAGRVSPESALFPYVTVDRIHDNYLHTGSKTLLRVRLADNTFNWEPFNVEHDERFDVTRNIFKNVLGNKLCFEEVNHDLQLTFRYTWETSDEFGFIRRCSLENLGDKTIRIELVDGLQNILPAGTPSHAQANASNLVDAHKWTELDSDTGLALYTLYSGISDRAEPCESLRANTAFCLGFEGQTVLLSSRQLGDFQDGRKVHQEERTRGIRGAYLVNAEFELEAHHSRQWRIVANVEQTQSQVVRLQASLTRPAELTDAVTSSIEHGSDDLARIMAEADGFQAAAEETVVVHHYANVLFNVLRGGIFDDQYRISGADFAASVQVFNKAVFQRNQHMLDHLPERLSSESLRGAVKSQEDPQLERLCYEYLPITFGRRHGDPSRPWNRFEIRLRDDYGNRLLSYQGNWRDIFQNWEALTFSYPEFVENVIAKFVNASTMDGYNPYRITKEGIDWEIEDPDDPWSYIGYWGDHQIIYLLKLLELSNKFHPKRISELLRQPVFAYANVPYRIKPFDELLNDPKNTVLYDQDLAELIAARVAHTGADGKLIKDANGHVYQVTLFEKLLVPLLSKLGNFVIDGGIWMNTQRPEWNDANNALVGNGLSMVTLYYIRRYVRMLQQLLADESGSIEMSADVCRWLSETATALTGIRSLLVSGKVSAKNRHTALRELGQAASHYRESIYEQDGFWRKEGQDVKAVEALLDDTLFAIDSSISSNRRSDGLYHAYNLMVVEDEAVSVETLYLMLEGQVAVLSSGAIDAQDACSMLDALSESDVYRADQKTFMLYPDRDLPCFLDKNRVPESDVQAIPLLKTMLSNNDGRVVTRDDQGCYRFNSDFRNVSDLNDQLDQLTADYGARVEAARQPLQVTYEKVFKHRAFTGRSGGMFGFEGLGCIYWHMVAKLLLAVQERYFHASDADASPDVVARLGRHYYAIREGIGFNKTPSEYGAFPTDPYSHTPGHSGAKQPGMTGQVKEEILTRFGELGLLVDDGYVRLRPGLLRAREFFAEPQSYRYLDIHGDWRDLDIPAYGLAFTWCQIPFVYRLDDTTEPGITVTRADGNETFSPDLQLDKSDSTSIFKRSGRIRLITVSLSSTMLFRE